MNNKFLYIFILFLLFAFNSNVFAASISVSPTSLDFGALSPSNTPVMVATPINVTWDSTGYTPFTIRVWTDNNGTGGNSPNPLYTGSSDGSGLVGVTYTDYAVALKAWCANYGPTGSPPSVADSNNWSNYWFWVPDYGSMDPGNAFTWRRLCWTGAELGSPFPVYIAATFDSSIPAQDYRTNVFIFEMINQ